MERERDFAAANMRGESYFERERNARWTALGVAHATRGHYGQCIDITFCPAAFSRVTNSILTYKVRRAKR